MPKTNQKKKVLIITGETSGDLYAMQLVRQLQQQTSQISFHAMGGFRLQQLDNVEILVDSNKLGVVGFFEILKIAPRIYHAFRKLKQFIRQQKPELVILVDYPGFNLRMAKFAKKSGSKVLYYISPQLWAWHVSRVKIVKQYVDEMAVILPFEVDFYQQHGVRAHFVGHPLALTPLVTLSKQEAREHYHISEDKPLVGLMPGSRQQEINNLLPLMLSAAKKIQKRIPNCQFVLPGAGTSISKEAITKFFKQAGLSIPIIHTYAAMKACDVVLVASGTATLELALLETPMVIVYKGSKLSYWLAKYLVNVAYIGLPNLIAKKRIVQELIQHAVTVDSMSHATLSILNDSHYRIEVEQQLAKIHQQLKQKHEYDICHLTLRMLSLTHEDDAKHRTQNLKEEVTID